MQAENSLDPTHRKLKAAVIGSGPAGLMAAWQLAVSGSDVTIYDKRNGAGWKLFVAGASGLNISNNLPLDEFRAAYTGPPALWERMLSNFSPDDWLAFIHELGQETFEGTSGRFFVSNMNATLLVREWKRRLSDHSVKWTMNKECTDFSLSPAGVQLTFGDGTATTFDRVCFALGGGSYEPLEKPLRWPSFFVKKGLSYNSFEAANVGFRVAWSPAFLAEAEGKPIKDVRVTTTRGNRQGDLMVTSYGLEGTPVYTVGVEGPATIDLQPNLTEEQIVTKLAAVRENLAPIRRVKRNLNLSPAAQALIFHHGNAEQRESIEGMARLIKNFSLRLDAPQSIDEAISSRGGIAWQELDDRLMLRRFPGVYLAGEMIDWEAPTGGFLIQGCVSMGAHVGRAMALGANG